MRSQPDLSTQRPVPEPASAGDTEQRLDEIERALKFDPDPEYRRTLIREYLDLTEPERKSA